MRVQDSNVEPRLCLHCGAHPANSQRPSWGGGQRLGEVATKTVLPPEPERFRSPGFRARLSPGLLPGGPAVPLAPTWEPGTSPEAGALPASTIMCSRRVTNPTRPPADTAGGSVAGPAWLGGGPVEPKAWQDPRISR